MNRNYRKGRRNEYRSMRVLEAVGYICIRSAGSHSPFDVIALGPSDVLLVQCKTNEWPGTIEMESLRLLPVPANTRKLIHRWDERTKLPLVKEI